MIPFLVTLRLATAVWHGAVASVALAGCTHHSDDPCDPGCALPERCCLGAHVGYHEPGTPGAGPNICGVAVPEAGYVGAYASQIRTPDGGTLNCDEPQL